MSSTLALVLQITATNGAAGVLSGLKKSLSDMGKLSKEAAANFDAMTRSLQRAGNAFAASAYINSKLKPGVTAAADLEEAMNRVKGNIAQVGDKADDLAVKLQKVRDTGREVSKVMPFSAKEVVDIQGALIKSGVDLEAVIGRRGAAYSAAGLASVSGMSPADVGDGLARVGKQYDFNSQDYKDAADILMKGEAASPGSLQELLYSLRQSGATAKLLGVSFKDAVTMSAAMTPLGYEAGTAVNRYILDSAGLTPNQRKAMVKLGMASEDATGFHNKLYKNGKYIGLDAENKMIREKFSAIPDRAVKLKIAHDIWGQEGMRAALMVGTGKDIFSDMQKNIATSLDLEARMTIAMEGFNMAAKAAAGTVQTALATAFTPALSHATALANKINDIADASAQWMGEHKTANNVIANGALAVGTGVAAYGLFNLVKGLFSGGKVLKSMMGGGASLIGGLAQGKAIEAATGVTPVFVTNFAQMNGGSIAGTATDIATTASAAAAAPGILKTVATGAKWIAYSTLPEIASLGVGAATAATAMLGSAAALGYGVGTVINKVGFENSEMQNSLGRVLHQLAAFLGSKSAQDELDSAKDMPKDSAHLHITIDSQGRASHEVIKKPARFGLSFNAHIGQTMVTP